MIRHGGVVALLVMLSSIPAAIGQDAGTSATDKSSVRPGINDAFLTPDLDVTEWVEKFEVESREVFASRDAILEAVALHPGDRVADIGTGTGLFLEPFSKSVGAGGWVFALDIAPKFIERVSLIADRKQLANVTPVLAGQDDVRLPPDSIDVAFICDVYHHFEFPSDSLASISVSLRPGGRLCVIDFERVPGLSREWTIDHVRAGKDVFRGEIEAAGFDFVEEIEIQGFQENYFLRFTKPAIDP